MILVWFSINIICIKCFPWIHNQILRWHAINNYSLLIILALHIFYSNMWLWDYSCKIIMNPKRLNFFSIPLTNEFTTKKQEERFFQDFANQNLLRIHTLEPKDFKEFKFFKTFEELNLSIFLCMPSKRTYTSLVKMFFSNLHLTDGILQSKVRRHMINLSVEEFGEMLDLSHKDRIIEFGDKVNRYNYIIDASSLMKEHSPSIPYPLNDG